MLEQAQQLRARVATLPRQLVFAVIGVAVVAIVVMFLILRAATSTAWTTIAQDLKPDQIEPATKVLEEKNIEHRIVGKSSLQVPKESEADAVGALATKGIAASHKLCDHQESSLVAATGEQQKLKERQCLENQIATTIESLKTVEAANVILTMPTDRFLNEESQVAEASVTVDTGSAELTRKEVQGLQSLVAGSVPNLKASDVTILDVKGPMLSEVIGEDGEPLSDGDGALSEAALKRRLERAQKTEIELDLIAKFEKVVGPGNVQVLANPELDMDQIRREIKDVGGEDNVNGPVVREDLAVETLRGTRPSNGGTAGTATNVTSPQNAAVTAGTNGTSNYNNDKSTTTYSNDEVREAVKVAAGSVKRYRISVVCNAATDLDQGCLAIQSQSEQYVGDDETVAFSRAKLAEERDLSSTEKGIQDAKRYMLILKYFLFALGLGLMALFIRRALNDRTYELLYPEEDMLELEDGFEPIPLKELEAAISAASTLDSQKRQELQMKVEQIAHQKPADVAQQLRGWLNDTQRR